MTPGFYRDIRPEHLPMPQGQVMQLIQCVLRDDADIRDLTRLISFNPTLTAQILGVVNSAFYGFKNRIHTIPDALVALGMNQLKSLILSFAVKEALAGHQIPGLDIDQFWGDSVFRGVAARQLGLMVNGPVEEAFSAGMLQDVGLLILFALEPEKADRWPLLRANLPDQRKKMESELFRFTHDDMGMLLTEKWHLPQRFARAIGAHHGPLPSELAADPLAAISLLADLCHAVFTCQDKPRALTQLQDRSRQFFNLDSAQIHTLLDLLPGQVTQAVKAMKIKPQDHEPFDSILSRAGQQLAQDNLNFQELTWQLQQTLRERDEYAARLDTELEIAREIQAGLLPDLGQTPGVAAFNLPALHLSGDFYDYLALPDGTLAFCLGDVSGKGTAAALLMAKTLALFRWLSRSGMPLEKVVEELNQSLCETAVRGMFVTLAAGRIHPETQRISLVNMGHPPPLLAGKKGIVQVQASGPPLGIMTPLKVQSVSRSFKDLRLYLYSDGFAESRLKQPPGQPLGSRGFLAWLVRSGQMPVQAQADWIMDRCWQDLVQKGDDLTLMILSGESGLGTQGKADQPPQDQQQA